MSSYFKNVLLIGATGEIGRYIFTALLDLSNTHPDQPINLSVLTRPDSKSTQSLPPNVTVHRGDVKDRDFLSEAFTGQDIVICAISPYVLEAQKLMLDVAAQVEVKRFLLGEFGMDTKDEEITDRVRIFQANRDVLEYAEAVIAKKEKREEEKNLQWTGLIPGVFFEMCMVDTELGFDFDTRTAKIYDKGVAKMEVSRMADVGKAVAGMIFQPEKYGNEMLYISNWTVGQADILEVLNKVDPKGPWKVENFTAQELQEEGNKKAEEGNVQGLIDEIWAAVFEDNGRGAAFSKIRKLSNKELGIVGHGEADLEETMADIIQEWENGRRK